MKIIIVFLVQIISLTTLFASSPNKDKIYNDMIKKYGTINTISAICDDVDGGYSNIDIKVKKGNKYRIKTNNMEIISDGKTIWSYSSRRKSVLISDFNDDDADISLDNIFFNVLPNLQPISLKSVLANNTNKQYILELHNKNKTDEIKIIYLYLDNKLTKIEGVEVVTNNTNVRPKWNIKKLEINKPISDSVFNFKTPDGVEEIDTR